MDGDLRCCCHRVSARIGRVGQSLLLIGVMLGSATWFVVLAFVAARLRVNDSGVVLCGGSMSRPELGLLGFAALLGVRTVREV